MVRKLTVVSLVVSLCLMGVIPVFAQKTYPTLAEYEKLTGKKIEKFNEAPMLKTLVAAGELPPVEQRISEEPMVVEPLEKIGQYGGTLKAAGLDPIWQSAEIDSAREQPIFKISPDLKTVFPNVARGWKFSKDYKTLTVYLRKGMKWSDGAPFTADDFLFWYEDFILNDELTPVKPKNWSPGGKLVKVEKIDDYTICFQLAVPYPPIIDMLAVLTRKVPCMPKHYLKQYHIKYNPKANEVAKEEGYASWWQCFGFHWKVGQFQQDPNLPVLDTWVLKKMDTAGNKYFDRNPYYWKVDTSGNQLPYIDEQMKVLIENMEIAGLKAIAGELSYFGQHTLLENYPLYKMGEKKGNYRVILFQYPMGSNLAFCFNLSHKDPVLRKIFNDIRWRQAMSLAINRDEINDICFFGKGIPRQASTVPNVSFYEPWMGEYYAQCDSEKANKLLDEMDLKWDKNHKYRLRSDGKTLSIALQHIEESAAPYGRICELVKDYWEKVGVKVAAKEIQRPFYLTRAQANELDVGIWAYSPSNCAEATMRYLPVTFRPAWVGNGCVEWWNWYNTRGKTGEEPPEIVKRLFNLVDEWQTTFPGTEEYMKLGKEILNINVKNLFVIGTVGMVPKPVMIKNNLRNSPEEGLYSHDFREWMPYQADQWFFEK